MWSCGILIYILLFGIPPFSGKTKEELLESIANYDIENDFLMNEFSIEVKFLIKNLLKVNPDERLTSKTCLNDPWILKHTKNKQTINHFDFNENIN